MKDLTDRQNYDPGRITIFYDARTTSSPNDRLTYFHHYWLATKSYLQWPSIWSEDLEPGRLRLVWYTTAGSEGKRDYPLQSWESVRLAFQSLELEGFRPMLLGWVNENPFPELGGRVPEETKSVLPKVRKAKTYSGFMSGHREGESPHDRVMAIIEAEEKREAEKRAKEVVGDDEKRKLMGTEAAA
ncbi:hypothetical protein MBLNU230_g5630t1 [Neophaeotheca triangularis]